MTATTSTLVAWRDELDALHAKMGRELKTLDIAVPSKEAMVLASVRRWVKAAISVADAELGGQVHESFGSRDRRRERHDGHDTLEATR